MSTPPPPPPSTPRVATSSASRSRLSVDVAAAPPPLALPEPAFLASSLRTILGHESVQRFRDVAHHQIESLHKQDGIDKGNAVGELVRRLSVSSGVSRPRCDSDASQLSQLETSPSILSVAESSSAGTAEEDEATQLRHLGCDEGEIQRVLAMRTELRALRDSGMDTVACVDELTDRLRRLRSKRDNIPSPAGSPPLLAAPKRIHNVQRLQLQHLQQHEQQQEQEEPVNYLPPQPHRAQPPRHKRGHVQPPRLGLLAQPDEGSLYKQIKLLEYAAPSPRLHLNKRQLHLNNAADRLKRARLIIVDDDEEM